MPPSRRDIRGIRNQETPGQGLHGAAPWLCGIAPPYHDKGTVPSLTPLTKGGNGVRSFLFRYAFPSSK